MVEYDDIVWVNDQPIKYVETGKPVVMPVIPDDVENYYEVYGRSFMEGVFAIPMMKDFFHYKYLFELNYTEIYRAGKKGTEGIFDSEWRTLAIVMYGLRLSLEEVPLNMNRYMNAPIVAYAILQEVLAYRLKMGV